MERISADVAIIGAGPAGMFAVFECGMLKMSCVLIDALDELGGQCVALYPEKPIYDIPAHPAIEGGALIAKLEEQIAPFNCAKLLGRQVTGIAGEVGQFRLTTSAGDEIAAKAIILAAGAGAFGPNRPPLDNLSAFEATNSVRYYVKRREDLRGKNVVIAGGGDSAVDWAIALQGVAASIALVHRRAKFRAAPESAAQLEALTAAGKIDMVTPYQLSALHGTNGRLEAVEVVDMDGGNRRLPADILLPFFGLAMELGPIAEWGLALDKHHVSVTQADMQSSLPGLFAVGDICTYPGKLKLILQGFAEAAVAAHSIYGIVNPDKALHFEYSTTKGVPG